MKLAIVKMRYFEDFVAGEVIEIGSKKVTKAEIVASGWPTFAIFKLSA